MVSSIMTKRGLRKSESRSVRTWQVNEEKKKSHTFTRDIMVRVDMHVR